MNAPPVIVVEDDPFTRLIPLLLDANPDAGRLAAFRQFMAHDEPDFDGWVRRVRATAGGLYPARVCMVDSQEAMRAALAEADVLVVEALRVGRDDLAAAGRLRLLQKFGTGLRNIDTAACAERGLRVLTLRDRKSTRLNSSHSQQSRMPSSA